MSFASQAIEPWQMATVMAVHPETAKAKTLRLRLPRPSNHLAGQHYVVRLTAPDGYTALRSHPVVSPPDGSPDIEITVERRPADEVSRFLHDEVCPADDLQVRGPVGGWFVWRGDTPALLVGGGRSSVVPLIAMLRMARRNGTSDLVRSVICVPSPDGLYYADELSGPETAIVYTHRVPTSNARPPKRLTKRDIPVMPLDGLTYICGSSSFADRATNLVLSTGTRLERIRTDRFSPSGPH